MPVAIAVAAVGELEAAIVMLDDEGLLSVCYLGTTPPTTVLGFSESREPDWDVVQDRRKELMRIIRDKAPAADAAATSSSVHDVTLRTSVRASSMAILLAAVESAAAARCCSSIGFSRQSAAEYKNLVLLGYCFNR